MFVPFYIRFDSNIPLCGTFSQSSQLLARRLTGIVLPKYNKSPSASSSVFLCCPLFRKFNKDCPSGCCVLRDVPPCSWNPFEAGPFFIRKVPSSTVLLVSAIDFLVGGRNGSLQTKKKDPFLRFVFLLPSSSGSFPCPGVFWFYMPRHPGYPPIPQASFL